MTQDELELRCKQTAYRITHPQDFADYTGAVSEVVALAEAVIAVERERCAKIAESVEWDKLGKAELGGYGRSPEGYEESAAHWIAALIRDSAK